MELPKVREYSQCGEHYAERATQVKRGKNKEGIDEQAWTGNVVYNLSLPASVYILVTIVIAL